MVTLFIYNGNLLVPAWYGTVEHLAMNLLIGTSLSNQCIHDMLPAVQKVVASFSSLGRLLNQRRVLFWDAPTLPNLLWARTCTVTLRSMNIICFPWTSVDNEGIYASRCIGHLSRRWAPGCWTHSNIVERCCSLTAQGLSDTFHASHLTSRSRIWQATRAGRLIYKDFIIVASFQMCQRAVHT